ncbi:hypothetical protein NHP22001_11200 [Helicobacter sp. NHP22-001]|nr:hypothetical protein NHP22001_11200 [Helicobacter sp. NHP22-001]
MELYAVGVMWWGVVLFYGFYRGFSGGFAFIEVSSLAVVIAVGGLVLWGLGWDCLAVVGAVGAARVSRRN